MPTTISMAAAFTAAILISLEGAHAGQHLPLPEVVLPRLDDVPGTGSSPCLEGVLTSDCRITLPERPSPPDLFGLAATPAYSSSLLATWDSAWNRPLSDFSDAALRELIEQAEAMPPSQRPEFVNRWVNWHIRFQEDQSDHWATPDDTLLRGTGDCEDFAILKMALLERVGIPSDRLFLVIVRDRYGPIAHAVTSLRSQDDAIVILDNRTDQIRFADQVNEYEPTLSFSGPFAWVYGHRHQAAAREPGPHLGTGGSTESSSKLP